MPATSVIDSVPSSDIRPTVARLAEASRPGADRSGSATVRRRHGQGSPNGTTPRRTLVGVSAAPMTTASAPGPAPTPPPAFPPPTPEELAAGSGGRANRLLASFAVVALLAAAVMTVLWLGERDDDTPAEPPPELSERAATLERELVDTEA